MFMPEPSKAKDSVTLQTNVKYVEQSELDRLTGEIAKLKNVINTLIGLYMDRFDYCDTNTRQWWVNNMPLEVRFHYDIWKKNREDIKARATAKLTDEEKRALGIS